MKRFLDRNFFKILLISLCISTTFPLIAPSLPASAQGGETNALTSCPINSTDPNCTPYTLQQLEFLAVRLLYGLWGCSGLIFMVLFMYIGALYLTSAGDQAQIESAKKRMTQWIIGIFLLFFAQPVVSTMMKGLIGDNACYKGLTDPGFTFFFPTVCTSGDTTPTPTASPTASPTDSTVLPTCDASNNQQVITHDFKHGGVTYNGKVLCLNGAWYPSWSAIGGKSCTGPFEFYFFMDSDPTTLNAGECVTGTNRQQPIANGKISSDDGLGGCCNPAAPTDPVIGCAAGFTCTGGGLSCASSHTCVNSIPLQAEGTSCDGTLQLQNTQCCFINPIQKVVNTTNRAVWWRKDASNLGCYWARRSASDNSCTISDANKADPALCVCGKTEAFSQSCLSVDDYCRYEAVLQSKAPQDLPYCQCQQDFRSDHQQQPGCTPISTSGAG